MSDVLLALALTTLAGLATGIGGLLAFVVKRPRRFFLPFALGFSAGVMIYISFVELLPDAIEKVGDFWAIFAFFVGIVFIAIIDFMIPQRGNPHHIQNVGRGRGRRGKGMNRMCNPMLLRTGMFTALAIGIHNFPEGMATFSTALVDIKLGVVIAIAIMLHNIPEGMSVSVPIYCATGSKKMAMKYSLISGLAEPVGAIIAYVVLFPFLDDALLASLLAFVAGIMVYISIDEILPTAHSFGKSHAVMLGLVLGMMVMAASLFMLL